MWNNRRIAQSALTALIVVASMVLVAYVPFAQSARSGNGIEVTTDKAEYAIKASITFSLKNVGSSSISGVPGVDVEDDNGNVVRSFQWYTFTGAPITWAPSEGTTFSWDQKTNGGYWAPTGTYKAKAHFGDYLSECTFKITEKGFLSDKTLKGVTKRNDGGYSIIIGSSGTVLSYDGTKYELQDSQTTRTLNGVSQLRSTRQATALIVGASGTVLKYYHGIGHDKITALNSGYTATLYAATQNPDGTYLIVGASSTILKYDGTSFTKIPVPSSIGSKTLYSVAWSPDNSFAIITGSSGIVIKYDGRGLTKMESSTTKNLYGVSFKGATNIAMIVGSYGTVLRYSSGTVSKLTSGTTKTLYDVAWDANGNNAYIVGSGGILLKFNGVSFTTVRTSYTGTSYGVDISPNAVTFVGSKGGIVNYQL